MKEEAIPKRFFQASRAQLLLAVMFSFLLGAVSHSCWASSSSLVPKFEIAIDSQSTASGWKTMNFHIGNLSAGLEAPGDMSSSKHSYSQIKQDRLVLESTGGRRDGYFVDLAANHARSLSNTLLLEQYGWNGLCIEVSPMYFWGLAHRRCKNIAAVVGSQRNEKVDFSTEKGAYGSIQKTEIQKAPDKTATKGDSYATVTLNEILEVHGAPSRMNYLSLDIEGGEEAAMRGFDFSRYSFDVMTIERPNRGLHKLLAEHGYHLVRQIGKFVGEMYYLHANNPLYVQLMQKHKDLSDEERFFGNCKKPDWDYLCTPRCFEPPYCAK